MLIKPVSSKKVSFISVLHFSNGAKFLNTSCVAALLGVAVILTIDLVKNFISSFCE